MTTPLRSSVIPESCKNCFHSVSIFSYLIKYRYDSSQTLQWSKSYSELIFLIILVFLIPASESYELPMIFVFPHLGFDQIFHKLCKWRVWISFIPFSPCCDTNLSAEFSNELLLNPSVSLKLVPVGWDNPFEGVTADHKGGAVLKLVDVGQFLSPGPESRVEGKVVLVIAGILYVRNKLSTKCSISQWPGTLSNLYYRKRNMHML